MLNNSYPFCAVLGQQQFKLALILSAINPTIGGVLVSGPRGSAKSTLARGIADILPGQHSLVTLPLAASEEMLVGSLDLQQVLNEQNVEFNPGLLAKAHNGVLYVDEVNLLSDPLVDLLLDVSASGVNYVERDGISHQHAAQFILLGTMNPDEGELRAQLLDRFGLSVNLSEQISIEERINIVRLRERFDRDPQAFIQTYQNEQEQLQNDILTAQSLLTNMTCNDELRILIATRCFNAQVDGLRADIVWLKAASAHAAWLGHNEVQESDVLAVEELILSHRRKQQGDSNSNQSGGQSSPFSRPDNSRSEENKCTDAQEPNKGQSLGEWGSMAPQQQKVAEQVITLPEASIDKLKQASDYNISNASKNTAGKVIGGYRVSDTSSTSVNWFTSLLASAGQWPPVKLRFKANKVGQPTVNCILLDTSASTLKKMQFSRAKAVVLQLAEAAYQKREQIVVFGFGNQQVQQLMAKQRAPKMIKQWLDQITAAGGTPLRDMINQLAEYQQTLSKNNGSLSCRNFLITDGRSNQSVSDLQLMGETLLIDIEDADIKRGRGNEIATELNGQYFLLPA